MASNLKQPEIPYFSIPGDSEELQELLGEARILRKSIHDLPAQWLLSGSKVTRVQFLALHVVHPRMLLPVTLVKEDLRLYGLNRFWGDAELILKKSNDFEKYLSLVGTGVSVNQIGRDHPYFPGSLRTVKDMQELCQSSARNPAGASSTAVVNTPGEAVEIDTEATVNTALVVILRELASLVEDRETESVLDRLVEKASFSSGASFTAITDGVLRRIDNKEIQAIFEVKKRNRSDNPMPIIMQESAEFATWAKNSRRKTSVFNNHLLIISQDGDEIFVSFACYNDMYVEYLQLASVENPASKYATIQTYIRFR